MSDNKDKLFSLREDLNTVMSKREELQAELNAMTTMAVKLQGAIEVLEEMENESKQKKVKLSIENWNPSKKKEIIHIIKNRFIFQSPLQKIKINHLQEISLKPEHFDLVLLGSGTDRLIEQINKLNQLQKSLPNLLINTKVKIVDLKDPTKPELKVERILNEEG